MVVSTKSATHLAADCYVGVLVYYKGLTSHLQCTEEALKTMSCLLLLIIVFIYGWNCKPQAMLPLLVMFTKLASCAILSERHVVLHIGTAGCSSIIQHHVAAAHAALHADAGFRYRHLQKRDPENQK